jgi:hypothetical protein
MAVDRIAPHNASSAFRIVVFAMIGIVVLPSIVTLIVNQTRRAQGEPRIRIGIWIFGRAGHRWYDADGAREVAPNIGLACDRAMLCRYCPTVRLDLTDETGKQWRMFTQVPDDPWLHWVAGLFAARIGKDDAASHWSLRTVVRSDDSKLLAVPFAPSDVPSGAHSLTNQWAMAADTERKITRAIGRDARGAIVAIYSGLDDPLTEYERIIGPYLAFAKAPATPLPTPANAAADSPSSQMLQRD